MPDKSEAAEYSILQLESGFIDDFRLRFPINSHSASINKIYELIGAMEGTYKWSWRGRTDYKKSLSGVPEASNSVKDQSARELEEIYKRLESSQVATLETVTDLSQLDILAYACLSPPQDLAEELNSNLVKRALLSLRRVSDLLSNSGNEIDYKIAIKAVRCLNSLCYSIRLLDKHDDFLVTVLEILSNVAELLNRQSDLPLWHSRASKAFVNSMPQILILFRSHSSKFSSQNIKSIHSIFQSYVANEDEIPYDVILNLLGLHYVTTNQKDLNKHMELLRLILYKKRIVNVWVREDTNYGYSNYLLFRSYVGNANFDYKTLHKLVSLDSSLTDEEIDNHIASQLRLTLLWPELEICNVSRILQPPLLERFLRNSYLGSSLNNLVGNLAINGNYDQISELFSTLEKPENDIQVARNLAHQINALKALNYFCNDPAVIQKIAHKVDAQFAIVEEKRPEIEEHEWLKLLELLKINERSEIDYSLSDFSADGTRFHLDDLKKQLDAGIDINPHQLSRWHHYVQRRQSDEEALSVKLSIEKHCQRHNLALATFRPRKLEMPNLENLLNNLRRGIAQRQSELAAGRVLPSKYTASFGKALLQLANKTRVTPSYNAKHGWALMRPLVEKRIAEDSDREGAWQVVPDELAAGISELINPIDGKRKIELLNTGFRIASLPWYDDIALLQIHNPAWLDGLLFAYYLVNSDGQLFRLNGSSPPIHEANKSAPIKLSSELVCAYLDFFCFFVRGEEGPFLVLHSTEQQKQIKLAGIDVVTSIKNVISPQEYKGLSEDGDYNASASILYSNAIFTANFAITPSGNVEMLNDEPLLADLPFRLSFPIS